MARSDIIYSEFFLKEGSFFMSSEKRIFSSERVFTKRLIIERLRASDWKFFKCIAGDPVVYRYFSEYQLSSKMLEKFFMDEIIANQDNYTLSLVIRTKAEVPIGILSMYYVKNGVWLVEYALLEAHRGKKYMSEVLEKIVKDDIEFLLTFKVSCLSIRCLLLEIPNDNLTSVNLIKKISRKQGVQMDVSTNSFYEEFESKDGWTWYRLNI